MFACCVGMFACCVNVCMLCECLCVVWLLACCVNVGMLCERLHVVWTWAGCMNQFPNSYFWGNCPFPSDFCAVNLHSSCLVYMKYLICLYTSSLLSLLTTVYVGRMFCERTCVWAAFVPPLVACMAYTGTDQVLLLEGFSVSVYSRKGQKRKLPPKMVLVSGWAQSCCVLSPEVLCLREGAQKLLAHPLDLSPFSLSRLSEQGPGFTVALIRPWSVNKH